MMNPMEIHSNDYQKSDPAMPPIPAKTMWCAIALLVVGILLIVVGFIEEVIDIDPTRGIAFWVLGSLVFIPGVFYTVKICQVHRAKTAYERSRILRELPVI